MEALVFHTIIPVVGLGMVVASLIDNKFTFGNRNPRCALEASLKSKIAGLVLRFPDKFMETFWFCEKSADETLQNKATKVLFK